MQVSGQLHAPAALSPEEKSSGTRWVGECVGHRAGLDAVAKREFSAPAGISTPIF